MRKGWILAAAGLLVLAAAAATTTEGQRAVRYLDRRFEWTEAGRQAHFDLLWQQAEAEFTKMEGRKGDYPARAEVLKRPALAVATLRTEIRRPWVSNFAADLLNYINRDDLRPLLQEYLAGDTCNQYQLTGGLAHAFPSDELKRMALELPAPSCRWAAFAAIADRKADAAFMQKFVLQIQDISNPELAVAAMPVYDRLGREARLRLLDWVGVRDVELFGPGESLQTLLDRETDPAVRQVILAKLHDLDGLVAAVERDGFFRETPVWANWMQTASKDPDSFVARGIRAYEQVRGLPYFQIDWRFRDKEYSAWWLYGNHQYDPAREIPGWETFLREFSRHEAAGYAGYRLGRCYEITGQYDKALSTLWRTATVYPNAEMVGHARARIVWILDAELDEPALRRLQVPELQGEIDYSIVLHELRAGRYADAVHDLDAVIAHGAPTGVALPRLREQREQAARLAALAGKTDAQSRYDLAAILYHNDIFSWASVDPSAVQGDMDPAYARWEAAANHLIRAAEAFAALADEPGAVGEKAAYSRAMALIRLAESYDAGTALWKPRREILAQAEALLTQFVAAHPKGDLTDDALLSLGFLKRDPAYFKRVVNEFPLSEVAATARSVNLKELPRAYPDREWVPFLYLTLAEAPPEVAAWAREVLAQGAHGQRTDGGVTYLVAGAPKPGLNGTLNLSDGTDGVIGSVQWQSFTPAEAYVLARVETSRPINFH